MSDLEKAARQALDVLEEWQNPPHLPDFCLEEWPIKWTDRGTVTITLTPRLLKGRGRSRRLLAVEKIILGELHNSAIVRLRTALEEAKLSPQDNSTNSSIAHSEGCWSWGPAHYECACRELAKAKGWAK